MLHRHERVHAASPSLPAEPDPMCPQCGDPLGHPISVSPSHNSVQLGMKCEGCGTTWEQTIAGAAAHARARFS